MRSIGVRLLVALLFVATAGCGLAALATTVNFNNCLRDPDRIGCCSAAWLDCQNTCLLSNTDPAVCMQECQDAFRQCVLGDSGPAPPPGQPPGPR